MVNDCMTARNIYFIRKLSHCWFLLICIWYTTVKIEGGHMCKNLVINIQYWLSYEFPRFATCTILNLACTVQYLSDFCWCLFQFNIKPLLYFFLSLLRNCCSVVFCWKKTHYGRHFDWDKWKYQDGPRDSPVWTVWYVPRLLPGGHTANPEVRVCHQRPWQEAEMDAGTDLVH